MTRAGKRKEWIEPNRPGLPIPVVRPDRMTARMPVRNPAHEAALNRLKVPKIGRSRPLTGINRIAGWPTSRWCAKGAAGRRTSPLQMHSKEPPGMTTRRFHCRSTERETVTRRNDLTVSPRDGMRRPGRRPTGRLQSASRHRHPGVATRLRFVIRRNQAVPSRAVSEANRTSMVENAGEVRGTRVSSRSELN